MGMPLSERAVSQSSESPHKHDLPQGLSDSASTRSISPEDLTGTSETPNIRLRDYTRDDTGRRIPAPPHIDRNRLLQDFGYRVPDQLNRPELANMQKMDYKTQHATQHQESQKAAQAKGNRPKTHIPTAPAFVEPLFPPLPLYGPPSYTRSATIMLIRFVSFCCTLGFLLVIILGAFFTTLLPNSFGRLWQLGLGRDPDSHRKFIVEERKSWEAHAHRHIKVTDDIPYYADLVGIDVSHFTCETLDGFTLHLHRLRDRSLLNSQSAKRYPVLMIHGLLQSAGAFCVNDEKSLAFYLCLQGFDVWLGNNRCWTKPEHSVLKYGDPRLWAWNIRQLGGLDLPAMIQVVCDNTGRNRIGFVGHSQGTTQTFCSLSRDQKPEIGLKFDSFCALAPAVFAGALIDKLQFKFMRVLGPRGFRTFFGINAFIPLMMTMQRLLPGSWYGQVGYLVFNFLFGWSDALWDRRLKSRFFQFSPVYVSAESMRWWMRDFAIFRSILEDGETVWYNKESFPPLAFWTCGQDALVNGQKFTDRMNNRESEILIVHQENIEEYSHLDVIWAMDACERVGKKVKEILWACATEKEDLCVPLGCDDVVPIPDPRNGRTVQLPESCASDIDPM